MRVVLNSPKQFVKHYPQLFHNEQSLYEAIRRGHFPPIVRMGRKIFIDLDRFHEWRRGGGSPLQKVA